MTVSVEGIAILDADGAVIGEYGYFDADAAPAIAALTDAFGEGPTESAGRSTNHPETNSINAAWPGFELRDMEREMLYPEMPTFTVVVTAGEVNGIAVQTSDGVRVGTPNAEVEQLAYRSDVNTNTGTEVADFWLEQKPVDIEYTPDYEPAALSIWASGSTAGGVIERFAAPGANWGA